MGSIKSSNLNAPFFIFGCGRSGTSLLSRMLNHHSEIAVPYESHLFNTFYPWLKYYGDLTRNSRRRQLIRDILSTAVMRDWQPPLSYAEIYCEIETDDFGGIFDAILTAWAKKQNKSRWGEKTPSHIDYWPQIDSYFPNAKVIHIVRDGRDVALSLVKARFGPKTIYAAAHYWKRYIQKAILLRKILPYKRFYEIRYEALLDNPDETLKQICDFLDASFEPQMLNFYQNSALYNTDIQNRANLQQPLLRKNMGKWRQEMDETDIRIFEAVGGSLLSAYGYIKACRNPHMLIKERLAQTYFVSPVKKIGAMVRNKKGVCDFLIRAKIFFRLILSNTI